MCYGTEAGLSEPQGGTMPDITPLIPRQSVPELTVPLVGGGEWSLASAKGDPFTMIVAYRGLHCPICKGYLGELQRHLDAFGERGVEVIAVSTDDGERAARSKADWGLDRLPVGHSMSLATARRWGLYISTSRSEAEPSLFAEPGLFLVRPDGTLYCALRPPELSRGRCRHRLRRRQRLSATRRGRDPANGRGRRRVDRARRPRGTTRSIAIGSSG
jgi:peroxiredoxin